MPGLLEACTEHRSTYAQAGTSSRMLAAEAALGRAQLAPPEQAEAAAYARAVARFRDVASPFGLAQALLGRGEALIARGDPAQAEPPPEEARDLFAELGARPWVERASRSIPAVVA